METKVWLGEVMVDWDKKEYTLHIGELEETVKANLQTIIQGRHQDGYLLVSASTDDREVSKSLDVVAKILDEKFAPGL